MKKIIITSLLLAATLIGYSQTIIVEGGKAVEVTPAIAEAKQVLTKENFINELERLKREAARKQNEISNCEIDLSRINDKIAEFEKAAAELGYK